MIFRVALILDPHYGNKLKNLCVDLPVWVVNSPENDFIIDALRANCSYQNVRITTFPLKEGKSRSHACERIIESLDQHYNAYANDNGYQELEIIGVALDEISKLPFIELGFTKFSQTNAGFIVYKASSLDGA